MATLLERFWWLSGWAGTTVLVVLYVLVEVLAIKVIGGNPGSFVFVTWHFIVAPLVAVFLILMTILSVVRPMSTVRRALAICSIAVDVYIVLVALRGDPGIAYFLEFR